MITRIAVQLKYVFNHEAIVAGWTSGLALSVMSALQSIDWTRFLAPGWFSISLLMLMTGEILTCFYSNPPSKRKGFNWEGHIRIKLLIASLGIVSLILDSIIIAIIYWLPWIEGMDFPIWGAGFLPITLSTLLWLNTAEAVRMVTNIAHSTGDENIPPIVLWVIRQIRRVDEARMPPGMKPEKRLLDHLTEDDIRQLLEKMEERAEVEPPPPPLGQGPEPKITDLDKEV